MAKVFIDAGHGGSDPGAVGNGLKEKNLTLAIAKECEKVLKADGVQVKMSRTGDTYPSLGERCRMANAWGADLFVSIHINAGGGTGFESYIYNGSVSAETKRLQDAIHETIANGCGLKDRGQKRAGYYVLRHTAMPAVLTENGFIDNKADAAKLKDTAWLKKVGRLHAEGILKFLGKKAPADPKPAKPKKPAEPKKPSSNLVKRGDNGDEVKRIQRALGGLTVDGVFGPKTEARVKAFQLAMGIANDGIVGPATRKYLFPAYPGVLLKRGSRGIWVNRVQWALGVAVDGVFGPKTEAAVKAFQKKEKISVDGIVGPVTWRRLFV